MSDAYFTISKSAILSQLKSLKDYSDFVSFSAKTNYDVAEVLENNSDCFFSIHTGESLEKIKDKSRIWFFAQAWSEDDIQNLIKQNVDKFVVDNESDLEILKKFLDSNDIQISLLLRMRLKEHTINTGKYFVFGMFSSQVNKFIPELRQNPKIKELGIHVHRKSQNIAEWMLSYEFKDLLSEETLNAIDLLNIGGGLPVKYKNFKADVLNSILADISKLKGWISQHNIKLIIEPGRYIAAPGSKLITTIKSIYNHNIIVNASVYNTAIDTFVAHHKLEIEGELEESHALGHASTDAYSVKGETPCSMDLFRYRVLLNNPKVGDKLVFLNAAAYNFSSDFCNLKKLRTEVVE